MNNLKIQLDNLEVDYDEINGIGLISVLGEIDLNNAEEFLNLFNKLLANKKFQLILDCSNIRYLDSSGIGVLIKAKSALSRIHSTTKDKKDVVLLNMSVVVKRALELTRLLALFNTFSNKEEAIDFFRC